MSETTQVLQRKIKSARELGSVVRTMKGLAAASIVQYERAIQSLSDYYNAVEFGLFVCLRGIDPLYPEPERGALSSKVLTTAIVFGSDQGLVGQFNDIIAAFALTELSRQQGEIEIWAVGERISAKLQDAGAKLQDPPYLVPNSITAITPLVSQILIDQQTRSEKGETYVFHNRPVSGAGYNPVKQRLLPLDTNWQRNFYRIKWPTNMLPEALGSGTSTLMGLVREYLFVSLFRTCAESLASENASRLAAMQRAQRNIEELLDGLCVAFNQKRQMSIDEELFDVLSGFELLANHDRH
jgi:F-type H+-transporting ATPase subunit gamma